MALLMVKDHGIGIEQMPYRKKLCLTIIDGNTSTKVASFNNLESAKMFRAEVIKMFKDAGVRVEGV